VIVLRLGSRVEDGLNDLNEQEGEQLADSNGLVAGEISTMSPEFEFKLALTNGGQQF